MSASCTPATRSRAAAPPWIWFWVVMYLVFGLPTVGQLWEDARQSAGMLPEMYGPGPLSVAMYPIALLDLLPALVIAAGLITVLFPSLRRRWVERRYGLTPPPSSPVWDDIAVFVHEYAPHLRIKANLLRSDCLAFVYPSGYRGSTVAILAPLLKLWRADRSAAEAVLLHEIAHHRRGDDHILGVGSVFELAIKATL